MGWLPVATFLGAYFGTTVIGATLMLTRGGRASFTAYLGSAEPVRRLAIGTPEYILLLFLPFALAPLFAYLGLRGAVPLLRQPKARQAIADLRMTRATLIGLTAAASGYCLLKLALAGKLLPLVLLDPDLSYEDKIIERSDLISLLHFDYYAVSYAVLPTLAACFLARYLLAGRQVRDGVGFLVTFVLCHYFLFVVYMKAPVLLVVVGLTITVIVARASWLVLPALWSISAVTFLTMQVLLGGFAAPAPPDELLTAPPGAVPFEEAISFEPGTRPAYLQAAILTGKSVVFRMASAYPFYLTIFRDPRERCGVQTNQLPLLPEPDCILAIKTFKRMYPNIDWVTGFAPAPAHVSAYGEVGLGYAILVIAGSGLVLGLLGAVGRTVSSPLGAVFVTAASIYGYYLSQVPFLGALTYSHGLVFYLLPLGILVAISLLRAAWRRRGGAAAAG